MENENFSRVSAMCKLLHESNNDKLSDVDNYLKRESDRIVLFQKYKTELLQVDIRENMHIRFILHGTSGFTTCGKVVNITPRGVEVEYGYEYTLNTFVDYGLFEPLNDVEIRDLELDYYKKILNIDHKNNAKIDAHKITPYTYTDGELVDVLVFNRTGDGYDFKSGVIMNRESNQDLTNGVYVKFPNQQKRAVYFDKKFVRPANGKLSTDKETD